MSGLPLEGIRVAEFCHYVAGPGATMVLADLGADVVKVEPLAGEASRHLGSAEAFVRLYNHGKRSIAVDLKSPAGLEVARRLIERSDVVVQNLGPGAMSRLGLGPDDVERLNPRCVYLTIAGFPSDSPSAGRPGYDIAAQAESGLMSLTGEPDGPPYATGTSIIDSATMHVAVEAVLAALIRRGRTGRGGAIEVSLLEVAIHVQTHTWAVYLAGGPEPTRIGNGQPYNVPAAVRVAVKDGYIVVSGYMKHHWPILCREIGREDLIEDPRFVDNSARVAHRTELYAELEASLAGATAEECVRRFAAAGLVCGVVRSYSEVAHGADALASGIFQATRSADQHRTLGLPYRFADTPRHEPPGAPALGEHTAGVLAELGYHADAVAELARADVIRQETS
jgi:crotonobetainyl-CoA:carnitine CoA-transferase CaiB-like acyl-CoA transferase